MLKEPWRVRERNKGPFLFSLLSTRVLAQGVKVVSQGNTSLALFQTMTVPVPQSPVWAAACPLSVPSHRAPCEWPRVHWVCYKQAGSAARCKLVFFHLLAFQYEKSPTWRWVFLHHTLELIPFLLKVKVNAGDRIWISTPFPSDTKCPFVH